MGQSYSYCTDGKERNKANAFVAVEEIEEVNNIDATCIVVEHIISQGNNTNTVTQECSRTMDTRVEKNDVNLWAMSLTQMIISEEGNTTPKVMFVDTDTICIPPCSSPTNAEDTKVETKKATEGIVSDMELFHQTLSEKMAMTTPTPKKKSNKINKITKTYYKATTPGTTWKALDKTPKKKSTTRTKKHKTYTHEKKKMYTQVVSAT